MKNRPPLPRIIEAERMEDGVIITFDDGKCAVYSTSLLHDTLPQAEAVKVPVQTKKQDKRP
jgi:hypothetical protein